MTPAEVIEAMGETGLTISIVYGPCGPQGPCRWSVQVMTRAGEEFERPFAADSFSHCVSIAEREAITRGWLRHWIR